MAPERFDITTEGATERLAAILASHKAWINGEPGGTRANLTDATLRGATLRGAILTNAYLTGAKNIPPIAAARTSITPEGTIVAWKRCLYGVIVKLQIPADARRSNATGRKCRAEFADVLAIEGADVGISQHDSKTKYHVGQRVTAHEWCEDRWQECAGGIHFFLTREEAVAYV